MPGFIGKIYGAEVHNKHIATGTRFQMNLSKNGKKQIAAPCLVPESWLNHVFYATALLDTLI